MLHFFAETQFAHELQGVGALGGEFAKGGVVYELHLCMHLCKFLKSFFFFGKIAFELKLFFGHGVREQCLYPRI